MAAISRRAPGLAAALASRCSLHTAAAACSPFSSKPALGVPATLPELPPRSAAGDDRAAAGLHRDLLCLSSINDPSNYGLAASPQGSGEGEFWWLSASSMSNPKEHTALRCGGAPSLLPSQGFKTATSRPCVQRKAAAAFRTSMADPSASLADPEQRFSEAQRQRQQQAQRAFQTSMADPEQRYVGGR